MERWIWISLIILGVLVLGGLVYWAYDSVTAKQSESSFDEEYSISSSEADLFNEQANKSLAIQGEIAKVVANTPEGIQGNYCVDENGRVYSKGDKYPLLCLACRKNKAGELGWTEECSNIGACDGNGNCINAQQSPEEFYPDNEKVMYGYNDYEDYLTNQPNFPELYGADKEFILSMLKKMDSLEKASEEANLWGWEYMRKGDGATAIKRFNQAWLLNPENPDVYWSFGTISSSEGDFTKSIEMFEKAEQINEKSKQFEKESTLDNFYCDYGYSLIYLYDNLGDDSIINEAIDLLEESISLSEDTSDCCTNWKLAVAYYVKGDYDTSWNQAIVADKLESSCTEQYRPFIADLNKASPA